MTLTDLDLTVLHAADDGRVYRLRTVPLGPWLMTAPDGPVRVAQTVVRLKRRRLAMAAFPDASARDRVQLIPTRRGTETLKETAGA